MQRTLPDYRAEFFHFLSARLPALVVFAGKTRRADKVTAAAGAPPWFRETATLYVGRTAIQPALPFFLLRSRPTAVVCELSLRMPVNWLLMVLCRTLSIRFYWWTSLWEPEGYGAVKVHIRNWIVRHLLRGADGVLVYNDQARRRVSVLAPRQTTVVCPNSVDVASIAEVADRIAPAERAEIRRALAPHGERIVLFIGGLQADKRVDRLIDALAGRPEWRGVIVGDGPLRAELERRSGSIGANVVFLGRISELVRLTELGRAADVFVLPGIGGLGLVHAAACGLPIVSCGLGDGTDATLVDRPDFGCLLTSNAPSEIATAIDRVLRADPESADRRSATIAKRTRSEWGFERMAEAFKAVYGSSS